MVAAKTFVTSFIVRFLTDAYWTFSFRAELLLVDLTTLSQTETKYSKGSRYVTLVLATELDGDDNVETGLGSRTTFQSTEIPPTNIPLFESATGKADLTERVARFR